MTENGKQKTDSSESNDKNHLLKEYELCWQGIQHTNMRLWTSASIFLTGSIVALVKMVEMPLPYGCYSQFISITIISFTIMIVLGLYLYHFIFNSLVLLDRIDIFRSEKIEKSLGLWRERYQSSLYEIPSQINDMTENESKRLKTIREAVVKRLETSEKRFYTYKLANKSFKILLKFIIFITFVYDDSIRFYIRLA